MDEHGVRRAAHGAGVLVVGVFGAAVLALEQPQHTLHAHLDAGEHRAQRGVEERHVEVDQLSHAHLDALEMEPVARQLRLERLQELRCDLASNGHGAVANRMSASGQTGIRFREALAARDAATAASLVSTLDDAHRIELLLGAALRDARDDHAAARRFVQVEASGGDWGEVCRLLCEGDPDRRLDELAAAYVAEGRVSELWRPAGAPLAGDIRWGLPDVEVAARYAEGVGGDALVEAFADLPLHAAVAYYYRRGTIHALGPRALLILAASAAPSVSATP